MMEICVSCEKDSDGVYRFICKKCFKQLQAEIETYRWIPVAEKPVVYDDLEGDVRSKTVLINTDFLMYVLGWWDQSSNRWENSLGKIEFPIKWRYINPPITLPKEKT